MSKSKVLILHRRLWHVFSRNNRFLKKAIVKNRPFVLIELGIDSNFRIVILKGSLCICLFSIGCPERSLGHYRTVLFCLISLTPAVSSRTLLGGRRVLRLPHTGLQTHIKHLQSEIKSRIGFLYRKTKHPSLMLPNRIR